MNQNRREIAYTRRESPLPSDLTQELSAFWEDIFDVPYDNFRGVLSGSEAGINRNILYVARDGSELVGTTQLTLGCSGPRLGGLGEVATVASQRRRGVGRRLCEQARDEFLDLGGEALFLGTVNPAAARLYHELGWRKLPLTNVMCLVSGDVDSEEFLVDYFRATGPATVALGGAAQRLTMIPLLLCQHDERVIDANLNLFSTRHAVQNSCMGLFPRYETLRRDGGQWFSATLADSRLVGLATARPLDAETFQVDGFAHGNFPDVAHELLTACLDWARKQEACRCVAAVERDHAPKRALFELLGFTQSGGGPAIDMNGTVIATMLFSRDCGAGAP